MSKASGSTQNVSQTRPANFQMPYVQQLLSEADRLYRTGGPQQYPGSTVPAFNADELTAQNEIRNKALTQGNEYADWAQQAYAWNLNQGRNPESNPYLTDSMQSAIRPIFDTLTEKVLPNVRQQAMVGGGFGGTRQSLAEYLLGKEALKQANETTTAIYNNAWNQGQTNANQTLAMTPQLQQSLFAPGMAVGAVGEQRRQYEQALAEEAARKFEYEQKLPYNQLAEYANYMKIPFGGYGESTSIGPPPSTAAQIGGGAAGILGLIGMLKQLGVFG